MFLCFQIPGAKDGGRGGGDSTASTAGGSTICTQTIGERVLRAKEGDHL